MNISEKIKSTRLQHITFSVIMVLALMFSLWKCRYGFDGGDEPFYFDVANRLIQGDALLTNEWHLSQLSAVLRVPLILLYKMFNRSTDGIILTMRILYIFCHLSVCIFMYIRLREYGYSSLVTAFLYFIFGSYTLFTFSYYAIAMDTLVISGVLIASADTKHKIPFILSGIFFSFAVLSSPYLAMIYIIYFLCVILRYILQKLKINNLKNTAIYTDLFEWKVFLYTSVGIFISAIIFIIFVLSRANINDIIKNLPMVLFGDPEHIQISLISKFIDYFMSILFCCGYIYFCFFAYFLIVIFMIFDIKRKNHREFYLSLSAIVTIVTHFLLKSNLIESYFTAIIFPMIFIGFTSYILCNKKPKKLFCSIFIVGILYSFAIHFSSNQMFLVIFMSMAVSNIASIIFMFVLLKEIFQEKNTDTFSKIIKKVCLYLCVFAICFQTVLQLIVKYEYCYYDGYIQNVTYKIEKGIGKGIMTSSRSYFLYNKLYDGLSYYKNKTPGNILIFDVKTWGYLYLDNFKCASYSAWLSGINETTIERLKDYYSLNPDKIPDYIYIPKDYSASLGTDDIYKQAKIYNYDVTENHSNYYLEKIK